MNFYNPFLYTAPVMRATPSLLGRFNLSSLINGANRTLNFINQTIPLAKQISPMMKNAKTMFKIMNEFKKTDISNSNTTNNINDNFNYNTGSNSEIDNISIPRYNNGPQFFI